MTTVLVILESVGFDVYVLVQHTPFTPVTGTEHRPDNTEVFPYNQFSPYTESTDLLFLKVKKVPAALTLA
jgi:hypothetical protein